MMIKAEICTKNAQILAQKFVFSNKNGKKGTLRCSKGFHQIACQILLILDPRMIKINAYLGNL